MCHFFMHSRTGMPNSGSKLLKPAKNKFTSWDFPKIFQASLRKLTNFLFPVSVHACATQNPSIYCRHKSSSISWFSNLIRSGFLPFGQLCASSSAQLNGTIALNSILKVLDTDWTKLTKTWIQIVLFIIKIMFKSFSVI